MDIKVYQKEEVYQPQGEAQVLTPDVIDLIPVVIEAPTTQDIRNNVWRLEDLQRIADVSITNGKLIINSDKVRYENGNLYVTLTEEQIVTCELVEDNEELEQQCALSTIFHCTQE